MILQSATSDLARIVGLNCRERDRREFGAVTGITQPDELGVWMGERYGSISGMLAAGDDEGTPICIGGAVHIRPGTCALLFYATDLFPLIALPMTRFIKRSYFPQLEQAGYHRIECVTAADYKPMHRWLETLGLQQEGVLRCYGAKGEHFLQFARVRYARSTSH